MACGRGIDLTSLRSEEREAERVAYSDVEEMRERGGACRGGEGRSGRGGKEWWRREGGSSGGYRTGGRGEETVLTQQA